MMVGVAVSVGGAWVSVTRTMGVEEAGISVAVGTAGGLNVKQLIKVSAIHIHAAIRLFRKFFIRPAYPEKPVWARKFGR